MLQGEQLPRGRKPKSQLERLIDLVPALALVQDGQLIFGDAVMISATEASSDRMPWQSMPLMCAVLVGCWAGAALVRGDYKAPEEEATSLSMALGLPLLVAMGDAMLTWACAMPLALAM